MSQTTHITNGGATKTRETVQGVFDDGAWNVSELRPGDQVELTFAWKRRGGAGPPEGLKVQVFPEVPRGSALPAKPFEELSDVDVKETAPGKGLAQVKWKTDATKKGWPHRLMFVPAADGWRTNNGLLGIVGGWSTPLVQVAYAWEVKSGWDPGSVEVGGQVTLTTRVHGIDAGKEATFELFYLHETVRIAVKDDGKVKSKVTAKLAADPAKLHETVASAPWTVPTAKQIQKLVSDATKDDSSEDGSQDQDEDEEDEDASAKLERLLLAPVHTFVFHVTVGDGDESLQGESALDVREPPFYLSL